jgi:hypothetical protein
MLGTITLVVGGFAFLVWRASRRGAGEEGFAPEGKLRWTSAPDEERLTSSGEVGHPSE